MKKLIGAGSIIIIIFLIIQLSGFTNNKVEAGNESEEYEYEYYYNDNETDSGDNSLNEVTNTTLAGQNISGSDNDSVTKTPSEIDTDCDSITVFVNKEYSLPSTFIPKDLVIPDVHFYTDGPQEKRYLRDVAAKALENMFSDASADGEVLYGVSGYRSYTRQTEIYNKNVRQRGSAATNMVSSIPGHSEHQTGLAIDISCKDLSGSLSEEFADTTEGQWVADNCYKYGFIIRYPKGCETLTGYSYEPWHIRYVGNDIASYIHNNNITFEEYYGYTPDEALIKQITSDAATAEKVTQYNEPSATPDSDKNNKSKDDKDSNPSDKKKKNKDKDKTNKKTNESNQVDNDSKNQADDVPATAAPNNTPATDNQSEASVNTPSEPTQPVTTDSPATMTPSDIPISATPAPAATDIPAQQDTTVQNFDIQQ